jgi:response regulator RpfG family c-di-GMP phosphodiesterase
MIRPTLQPSKSQAPASGLARVLLVDANPTSRMTLRTVLEAGGYSVRAATTTVEAMELLDHFEFELVLCNSQSDPENIDEAILAYARFQDYEPATATLTTVCEDSQSRHRLLVEPQNLPDLLDHVAALVGERALARLEREIEADRRVV